MHRRARGPLIALFGVFAIATADGGTRVHRAERIASPFVAVSSDGGPGKPRRAARATFSALDREFDLELESNDRLLTHLPAARRAEIERRVHVYRGRLAGRPSSWVRLTRVAGETHALIWDGNEFLSIVPARDATLLLDPSSVVSGNGDALIYRVADTTVDLGPEFCAASTARSNNGALSGADAFDAVLGELRSVNAATAASMLEIELSLIGDYEFSQRQEDPEGALLARFNVVDGIFSEQLHLKITAGRLDVFTTAADPFTSSAAGTLLDQVGKHRRSNAALAAYGLTHLVTGRNLDGSTVGIGYVGGVCDSFTGSAVSSDMASDVNLSALIAAHEMGHNLGAEHDDEAGSVCASTPDGYLMAPAINFSSTFSQCSIDTMRPVIEAAPCVFPAEISNIRVVALTSTVSATVRRPVNVAFDLRSIGNLAVTGTRVLVESSDPSILQNVSLAGGTCVPDAQWFECDPGSLPAGESRRVTVTVQSLQPKQVTVHARVIGGDDEYPDDNVGSTVVDLTPRIDVSAEGLGTVTQALVGEPFTLTFLASAQGIENAEDVVFAVTLPSLTLLSYDGDGGACRTDVPGVECSYGALSPGDTRRITVTVAGGMPGPVNPYAYVRARYDDVFDNEYATVPVAILPTQDLRLSADSTHVQVDVESAFDVRFTLTNIGTLPMSNATVDIRHSDALVALRAAAPEVECKPVPDTMTWRCEFDRIEPGAAIPVTLRVRSNETGNFDVRGQVRAAGDQAPMNSNAIVFVRVMQARDLYVEAQETIVGHDGRPFRARVIVNAAGRLASTNAAVDIALPESMSILGAIPTQGDCRIGTGTVKCTFGTIEPDGFAYVDVDLSVPVPGRLYGTATVTADTDGDAANDQVTLGFDVRPATDVSVTGPASRSGTVGEFLEIPIQVVASTQAVTQFTLRIQSSHVDSTVDATTAQGSCATSSESNVATCTIDALPAFGTADVAVLVRADFAGSFPIYVYASLPGDIEASNDRIEVEAAIESPPPVVDAGGSSGSGGGGRLDLAWIALACGLMVASARVRRKRASDVRRQ